MSVTTLSIRELGPKGDGIHLGFEERVYVERAIPGDEVVARVQRDFQGIPRAEILEILQPSAFRQEAPCPHYDHCGNCTLQHLAPNYYQDWKVQTVIDALQRYAVEPNEWQETIFIKGGARRRATFSARKDRGRLTVGYYRRRSQQITDITSCLVADPQLLKVREIIKPFLNSLVREGNSIDCFVQVIGAAVDVVFTGSLGRNGVPDKNVAAELEILLYASPITRIGWRSHQEDAIVPVLEKNPIEASFGPLKVDLPAAAFMQPTAEGERALVAAVMRWLPSRGKFADLFSGCGTFTGPMLTRGSVDAYESSPPAVAALNKAALKQPLKAFRRDLYSNPLRREELDAYDAIVFDPPRAGCPEQAKKMASAKTPVLIGVSCNPATFARDARLLCEGGYRLQNIQIIDQFIWSHHVEMVGVFTR